MDRKDGCGLTDGCGAVLRALCVCMYVQGGCGARVFPTIFEGSPPCDSEIRWKGQ